MPLSSLTLADFLDQTAAKTPTPGGGAIASVTGALAAALAQMVVSYSVGKKSLAAHEPALRSALAELTAARTVLLTLAEEDAAAYGLVNELMRLPETDLRRLAEFPGAVRTAVAVPQSVLAAAINLLRHFEQLAPITNHHLRSDLAIAAVLAEATARASAWNIRINASLVPAEPTATSKGFDQPTIAADVARSLTEASARCLAVETACRV